MGFVGIIEIKSLAFYPGLVNKQWLLPAVYQTFSLSCSPQDICAWAHISHLDSGTVHMTLAWTWQQPFNHISLGCEWIHMHF